MRLLKLGVDKGDWIKVMKHHPEYPNRIGYATRYLETDEESDEMAHFVHVSLLPEDGIGENKQIEIEYGMISPFYEMEDLVKLALQVKSLMNRE